MKEETKGKDYRKVMKLQVSTCTWANTELKERGGTMMGGLRRKPWSSKDVHLGEERGAIVKNKTSAKTHLVLQKDLSDQNAFFAASEGF